MKKLYRLTALVVVAVMLGVHGSAQAAPAAVPTFPGVQTAFAFRFISWGDGQFEPSAFARNGYSSQHFASRLYYFQR